MKGVSKKVFKKFSVLCYYCKHLSPIAQVYSPHMSLFVSLLLTTRYRDSKQAPLPTALLPKSHRPGKLPHITSSFRWSETSEHSPSPAYKMKKVVFHHF